MALVAKAAHEDYQFELNLRLEKQGEVLARGRVRSGFVRGQTLVLQTSLSAECLGKLDCAAGETCVVNNGRASCEDAAVDSGSLPRVNDAPKSNDAGTGTVDAGKPYSGKDAGMSARDAGATADAGTDSGKPDVTCIPSAFEICDNGVDDNCDGQVDCADDGCQSVTLCVPNAIVFALVGADQDCPDGYTFRDFIYQDLKDPGCGGCSCVPTPKTCTPSVYIYDNADTCAKDSQPYAAGTLLNDPATSTCSLPIGKQIDLTTGGYGFRVTVKDSTDACTATGEAKPVQPVWNVTMKRCSTQLRRGGCHFGSYCAHTRSVPLLCRAGGVASACESTESANTYYTGFDDKRSCDACSCAPRNAGSCKDVGATMSSDATCTVAGTTLHDGQKSCEVLTADAAARMTGKPRDPTCSVSAAESGTVIPSNAVNLCCSN